jgi:hypothetical protein
MAHHAHHPEHHADVSHETSDVNIRGILASAAGLIVLGAVVYFVVWLFFVYLSRQHQAAAGAPQFPLAVGQADRLPPEPRLQVNPRQDLKDLRAVEEQLLTSYVWVDRNAGVVRIPIDEAMKLTLQRGFPSRPASEQEVVK